MICLVQLLTTATPGQSKCVMQSQPAAPRAGSASAATNVAAQPAEAAPAAAAASDALGGGGSSNAASTATAKPTTTASSRNPPANSKSQTIPKGKTTANQRMTRAAAAGAAAELADTAPGSVLEEDEEAVMDQDMAEGSSPDYDMVRHQLSNLLCELWHKSVSPGHVLLLHMSFNSSAACCAACHPT